MDIENNSSLTANRASEGALKGVVLLTASTMICKVIGLFFKIPIINIVGIDGMAYFTNAYNVYMMLNALTAAGLPVALSIMVSKNRALNNIANLKKVFNTAFIIFLILGFSGSLLLFLGADSYSNFIGMSESAASVRAIAPTLLLICISGAIRGFFQGYEIMAPTAVSQMLESFGKLLLGIAFATITLHQGGNAADTAASAVLGLSVGVLISTSYLIIKYLIFSCRSDKVGLVRLDNTDRRIKIVSDLAVIALPVTLSASVNSLTSLADTVLITNRLIGAGWTSDAAVTLYSSYSNFAIPLFNLPPALVTSVALALVPALTAALATNDSKGSDSIFRSSTRLCLAMALPAAAGLGVFARPIILMIFPGQEEACRFAAPLLSLLSVSIIFCCVTTVCNAVLQAHLKTHLPIIAMAIGAIVKIVIEYLLIGSKIGIYGAPISTLACTFTIMALDIWFVYKVTYHRFESKGVVKLLASSVISVSIALLLYLLIDRFILSQSIALIIAIIIAIVSYAVLVILFKAFSYEDLLVVPFGKKLADVLLEHKMIIK